jgi:DNA-binding CsgD family transcriptional regulator/PAS domain-containing protein
MNEIAARLLTGTPVDAELLPRPDDEEELSELIGTIYDASLDPSRWPDVLQDVRDYVGGMAANIYAKSNVTGRLARGVTYGDGGLTPQWVKVYRDQFAAFDPATPGELRAKIGNAVSTTDVADYDEYIETRFYREWQVPQGMVDFIAAPLEKSSDRTALFCIFRHERDGMIDARARRRMRLIIPHIRRAVLITEVVEQKTCEAESFREAMDGISAGLFFVDRNSRIVHANSAGSEMLEEGAAVVQRGGRLAAVERPASQMLADAAVAATGGDAGIGVKGVSVPIASLEGDHFAAHVLPLTSGSRRPTGAAHAASAAVFVHRAELATDTGAQLVARAFGLTPTEERVLASIVDVGGVPETAEALGIGEATVKTHLHRVFGKTGAERQAELVKLVAIHASPLSR